MKFKTLFFFLLCFTIRLNAGTEKDSVIVRKTLAAERISIHPKIDGILDDECWKNIPIATNFIQNSPTENAPVSFQTEVKVAYDNTAIYISAMCYDNSPDSILHQLGLRDDYPNADNFRMVFDTYNTQQDAFDFVVTASNVQNDSRYSDNNFNAVWTSEVKILSNGWSVEVEIPWSALRFPNKTDQIWGVQFTRSIQRKFEFDQWALTPKEASNSMNYWGILTGLNNIESPLRLSLTPYISTIVEKDSRFGPASPDASIGGGLGLKYGLNESFTLDMTLLPDFSQVKSDNLVKNLSPFEIQFNEQRPFFTEGTGLFDLGGIFYSRRIGGTPSEFYNTPYLTGPNEKITKNPGQSKMLNASKISGRTTNGMGIGILNAFIDNTYATATDTITGEKRKILTEPSSNYNIFVFDKQLSNSSHVYVTNSNVIRSHGYRSANVTATGFSVNNKKQSWNFNGDGGVSNVMEPTYTPGNFQSNIGYYYRLGLRKSSGKFQYGIDNQTVNENWDCNDMGYNNQTNYSNTSLNFSYNLFNPWKIFNYFSSNLNINYGVNLKTSERNNFSFSMFNMGTFKNFWSLYLGTEITPIDSRDFYEPRVAGRFYLHRKYEAFFGGINSNRNKKFYGSLNFDGGVTAADGIIPQNPWGGLGTELNLRVGNRFSLGVGTSFHGDFGDRGWVDIEQDGTIVFGRRILHTLENGIGANFVFTKDMSLSFRARHFWETGHYRDYYVLNLDGTLTPYINYANAADHDFDFNNFNIDLVYNWNFAPGSTLSLSWKQNILNEQSVIDYSYQNNFSNTIKGPQLNQVSLRVLYYLDYSYVKKAFEKHP